MEIKVNNKAFRYFDNPVINLKYDSVASTFSAGLLFNPDNADHREVMRPLSYPKFVIEDEGEIVMTGRFITNGFKVNAVANLAAIGGYSLPGVLEDCEIPPELYPLQTTNLSLKHIAEKLLQKFGIELYIDPAVQAKANAKYKKVEGGDGQKVKAFLAEMAAQKHIMLTHDNLGRLVLTEAKYKAKPFYHFEQGMDGIEISLQVDGQNVHSDITAQKQATKKNPNSGKSKLANPYVNGIYRPRTVRQNSGQMSDTGDAARNLLGEELKSIKLTVQVRGWRLNNELITPNKVISVKAPQAYLFNTTHFFIESVDLGQTNEKVKTATLTCYPVDAYSAATPKNMFV